MTSSTHFVRAKLHNLTQADCSELVVKDNRAYYHLRFEESVGFDWLKAQVYKASKETEISMELWKIHPSGVNDYEVSVREIGRREGIDEDQRGLTEFEA